MHEDVACLTRELGHWHPRTLAARSKVSSWFLDEGLHTDALRLAEAEVADRIAEFGADAPETLMWRGGLAWSRRRTGDLDTAVTEARALADDCVRVLGSDHVDTHRHSSTLAQLLAENGESAEGVRLARALYAESQTFGLERWSETRSLRTTLITALELNGDVQEALDLLDEEIKVESGTLYGIDENLGDYEMKRLEEWRRRLVAKVASA
ncbi:hypothetical protein CW362_19695 [Streptomyces populi]|uniref:Tetratricopeptide repeat protein n=1 Tax=Streptomyces populi TaxID=2058924 RepID=A0A2I0SMX5_9ACTN|nr:hypothetical protein [Streptomyces populi]PKT71286.1 hypothetical protein CW362_19695 [Streptomyces populi]